ncbi:MAG: hypothetical protein HIU84_11635 [Acidobacteria bacterium]|nr:hypothetical protein [Acidobacteriota bacterium]
MPGDLIVLNGPSSAGKSTLIRHLQHMWPRPLYATGIDALIVGWPEDYFLDHDESGQSKGADALHIVAGLGPSPSWVPRMNDTFFTISRHSHEAWAAMNQSGVDMVIDHCIIEASIRKHARDLLVGAFWVGVTCEVEELIRQEALRGDRYVGFASGTSAVVHDNMKYDMTIDTTSTPPPLCQPLVRQFALTN